MFNSILKPSDHHTTIGKNILRSNFVVVFVSIVVVDVVVESVITIGVVFAKENHQRRLTLQHTAVYSSHLTSFGMMK